MPKKRPRKRRLKRSTRPLSRQERQQLSKRVRELYPEGANEKSGDADWSEELELAGGVAGPPPQKALAERSAELVVDPEAAEARVGTVVTLYSGLCEIEHEGRRHECVLPSALARHQQSAMAVGDEARFAPFGDGHRVLAVEPRHTVLSRPDPHNPRRERVIAANVDVVVVVASVARPPLRPALVDRYLIVIERGGAAPLLAVNKIDLVAGDQRGAALTPLVPHRELGIPLLECSAHTGEGVDGLRAALRGKTAVFVGHSGVGKSSLMNALMPDLELATGEVSQRYSRGRHTTTRSHLYSLAGDLRLIDTPGIRELGLYGLEPEELRLYFPDFHTAAARCRFNDCTHSHEPDCGVRAALLDGEIRAARYATYRRILESLEEE